MITKADFERVANDPHALPKLVVAFLEQHGKFGWKCILPISCGGHAMGVCNFATKTISIVNALVNHGHVDDIVEVAIHECAHALTPSDREHGKLWQAKAKELGINASKFTSTSMSDMPVRVQRIFYTHRMIVHYPNGDIEYTNTFVNRPRRTHLGRNVSLSGRPETKGRLRYYPI